MHAPVDPTTPATTPTGADGAAGAAVNTETALPQWPPAALAVVGPPRRYVELFRCAVRANARLVAEWLRVGYTQGNMNRWDPI